jgi:hypothetical protein
MRPMNLEKVSSEELISMFEEVFENKVAKYNNIESFGVECSDRGMGKDICINVDISGHAGTPTIDEFRSGKVENSEEIVIEREDLGSAKFSLVKELTTFVSGNDYLIVYKASV